MKLKIWLFALICSMLLVGCGNTVPATSAEVVIDRNLLSQVTVREDLSFEEGTTIYARDCVEIPFDLIEHVVSVQFFTLDKPISESMVVTSYTSSVEIQITLSDGTVGVSPFKYYVAEADWVYRPVDVTVPSVSIIHEPVPVDLILSIREGNWLTTSIKEVSYKDAEYDYIAVGTFPLSFNKASQREPSGRSWRELVSVSTGFVWNDDGLDEWSWCVVRETEKAYTRLHSAIPESTRYLIKSTLSADDSKNANWLKRLIMSNCVMEVICTDKYLLSVDGNGYPILATLLHFNGSIMGLSDVSSVANFFIQLDDSTRVYFSCTDNSEKASADVSFSYTFSFDDLYGETGSDSSDFSSIEAATYEEFVSVISNNPSLNPFEDWFTETYTDDIQALERLVANVVLGDVTPIVNGEECGQAPQLVPIAE